MISVYAIGSNGSGQLGIGHKEDVSVPKLALFNDIRLDEVTQVKAGGNHTLVQSSGSIFVAGELSSGACGPLPDSSSSHPQFWPLRLDQKSPSSKTSRIKLCAASWDASFVVLEDENGHSSKVYSFGTGNKGELGVGELIFRASSPQLINDFPPPGVEVVDLAASVTHAVAVLSNGDVYGWGNGRKGQIGTPDGMIYKPRKINNIDFKVIKAVCGREFTYLLGTPDEGKHIILGSDKWNLRSSAPKTVPGWKDAGASWGSIFLLQQDGKLLSWGRMTTAN